MTSSLSLPLAAVVATCSLVAAQTFTEVGPASGITLLNDATQFGTGQTVADFDGDGDLDIVAPDQAGLPIRYYRNDGGMTFTDLTATANLGVGPTIHGVTSADVDNDGDQDVFVCCWDAPDMLFINDGTGVFSEQAAARGLGTTSRKFFASFGDFDRDGWLDLYIGNRTDVACQLPNCAAHNMLFRNTGNGYFVDVTATYGVEGDDMTFAGAFIDFDDDGWPDITTANDKGGPANPNSLWQNNGGSAFTEVATAVNAGAWVDGMGLDYADAFNDGGWDIYCSDSAPDHLFLVWDAVAGQYVQSQATYGVEGLATGWAVNFSDFDNDGWQDLYVVHIGAPNRMYINAAQPAAAQAPWTDVATGTVANPPGATSKQQYTALLADFDNDGDIDVFQRLVTPLGLGFTLQRNDLTGTNWIKLELEGVASNRDGQGASVRVRTGTTNQRQQRRSGTGFVSTSDPRLHFGLGAATIVDEIEIRWPSGQVQRMFDVPANQILRVVEPSFGPSAPPTLGTTVPLELVAGADAGADYAIVLAFAESPATLLPDGTMLPIAVDPLTALVLQPGNQVLSGATGTVGPNGTATASFVLPPMPVLAGITVYATAVTVDPVHAPAVRNAFPSARAITFQ
jgi:hypothetical protein